MARHFKLTNETKINIFGVTLFRIECAIDCKWAKVGDKGGWVEKEDNLSGNAWVYGNAEVSGNARVSGNASVYGNAEVYGNASVYGNAEVYGNASVSGNARVSGNAWVSGNARVSGNPDYCCFQSFGTCGRTTTAFKEKDGNIRIRCGCFGGTIEEFLNKVTETHGDSKLGREYKAIVDVIKIKFSE
ncbi:MAG: hypothetical protein IIW91_07835 [Alistipes sp.]|nr:hypothetical protein [Alistipes sp.]